MVLWPWTMLRVPFIIHKDFPIPKPRVPLPCWKRWHSLVLITGVSACGPAEWAKKTPGIQTPCEQMIIVPNISLFEKWTYFFSELLIFCFESVQNRVGSLLLIWGKASINFFLCLLCGHALDITRPLTTEGRDPQPRCWATKAGPSTGDGGFPWGPAMAPWFPDSPAKSSLGFRLSHRTLLYNLPSPFHPPYRHFPRKVLACFIPSWHLYLRDSHDDLGTSDGGSAKGTPKALTDSCQHFLPTN